MDAVKKVDKGVWVVEESVALNSLTIAEGASLAAPEGKSLTMTVYGVGTPIKPGSYKGDIFLTVTDNLVIQPGGLMKGGKPKEFRTAILVEDGKYVPEKSVPAIVKGGQVTDQATTGITIQGSEHSFNGIIVKGDSEYTIEGVNIDLEGDRGNDFIGFGAGIMCIDNTRVTVNNSDIHLLGLTRCAVHVGGNSVTTLNNCRISNDSPPNEGMNVVWMLGLRGTNRATMLCEDATVYYNNCHIRSNGWGVCAVDGPIRTRMYLKDSTIELKGPRARGYGAFSHGDCFISYDHCTVNVQGYPFIIGGLSAMGGNQKSGGEITNGTIVNSTLYGAMMFRDEGARLTVNKGATLNTASSVFLVKGTCAYLNIDNAILNPANSVILQLMDDDEPGFGPSRFIVPIGEVDVAIPGRDLTVADPKEDVFMTLSNMEVKGDFYNSTTNLKAHCRETEPAGETADWPGMNDLMEPVEMDESAGHGDMKMDAEALQGAKNLDLKFTNVKVNGVISAATHAYKDGVTVIDVRNCEELSNVTQTAHEPVNNGVIVSLDKDCVWTVAGTSYLTSLTVAEGAVIKATEGKSLTMTVDGVKTEIAPGTYTGKIIMTVA